MPTEGLCLEVTYLGPGAGPFYLNDVHDGFDARNQRVNGRRPGPLYLNPNVPVTLIYTSDVAKSFESGAIRVLIDAGRATATFVTGTAYAAVGNATEAGLTGGGTGSAVMDPASRIALCDTSGGAFILIAPPVGDGRLTVRITAGANPVQVTPSNLATEGIDGPAGSTYTIDPGLGQFTATFAGDTAQGIWWLV